MGSRTPSNNSTEEVAAILTTEAQIDIDLSHPALSPLEEDETIAMPTAPAEEYVEDILDFDDDELVPANIVKSTTAEEQAASAQASDTSRLYDAKLGMAWSAEMMLTQSPDLASALHLHHVGDAITVQISVHGVTYDICWTIAAITSESSATSAPAHGPASEPPARSAIKCKFGKFCKKGGACAFDHSAKSKLCIWINTPTGCAKGGECEYSHECEGVKCTKGDARGTCMNGSRCAYKHEDNEETTKDVAKETQDDGEEVKMKQDGESTKENGGKEKGEGEKDDADQGAGKKRGHEDGEDDGTPKKQRLDRGNAERGGKQFRGRGRGRGHGRGRGRGRGSAQGIRVRGAANKGAE
jgi:hypothetical protein